MAKAIIGAAEIATGTIMELSGWGIAAGWALISAGVTMEAAAAAEAMAKPQGEGITTHQAAGLRDIVYGEQRLFGKCIYQSTTGAGGAGGNYLYNKIIAVATHEIDAFINMYLDGRQVFFSQDGSPANIGCGTVSTPPAVTVTLAGGVIAAIGATGGAGFANVKPTRYRVRVVDPSGSGAGFSGYAVNSGTIEAPVWAVTVVAGGAGYSSATWAEIQGRYTFGGNFAADQQDPTQPGYGLGYGIGPTGAHYNFAGKGYAEVRFGDQPMGDTMESLTANDPTWSGYGASYEEQATATASFDSENGSVPGVEVTNQGYGYSVPPPVSFSPGGASATATVSGGRVTGVVVTNPGSGYASAPSVTIGPPDLLSAGGVAAPTGMECAYIYFCQGFDSTQFPQPPEFRVTVNGANGIYDPRTGLTGFTFNWALQVADVLSNANPMLGLGDRVNQAHLICAANICDEMVATSQGDEARWWQSLHWDTSTAPPEALALMMPTAGGRCTYIGGEWFVWPAAWVGSSFTADAGVLAGEVTWEPFRDSSELINCVNGTYIAPSYPYNASASEGSNLYDANGWFYGQIADTWPFQFQPTNFPQYARDPLHGYASAIDLAADGGITLPKELSLRGCLSIVQAQRAAKVTLMRNRFQGSGSLEMMLSAIQLQEIDVLEFAFPLFGWTAQLLEVGPMTFAPQDGDDETPGIVLKVPVVETDPSIYEWSAEEELTPYDVPAVPGSGTQPQLTGVSQVLGATVNPAVASAFADLPELGASNAAMTLATSGNASLLGVNLGFASIGSGGAVASLGVGFGDAVGTSPPSIGIAISGDGSGASASIAWAQSGTYPSYIWTPTITLTGGANYTAATATVTVSNPAAATGYSTGTYTYTCSISSATGNADVPVTLQVLMDGAPVLGPLTVLTNTAGVARFQGLLLLTPGPTAGSHLFQVQAMTDSASAVASTSRSFQLIQLP